MYISMKMVSAFAKRYSWRLRVEITISFFFLFNYNIILWKVKCGKTIFVSIARYQWWKWYFRKDRVENEKNFAMEYLYNEKLIFCRKLIFLLWNDHRVRIFHCNFKQAGFNGIFEHRIENILIFSIVVPLQLFPLSLIFQIVMIKIRG